MIESDEAIAMVDDALARAERRDRRCALNYAIGFLRPIRGWDEGWPGLMSAARDGDPVAVEVLCRLVDFAGLL